MIINVAARREGNSLKTLPDTVRVGESEGLLDANSSGMWTDGNDTRNRYLVEVGFVMSTFTPKMGWSPVWTSGGLGVSAQGPSSGDPRSISDRKVDHLDTGRGERQLPFRVTIGDSKNGVNQIYLTAEPGMGGFNDSRLMPGTTNRALGGGLIPAGGLLGPRVAFNRKIALCRPFVIAATAGGALANVQIIPLPREPRRLYIYQYDNSLDAGSVISHIDLQVPDSLIQPGQGAGTGGISIPTSGMSLRSAADVEKMFRAPKASTSDDPFPNPNWFIRSWVLPHGDYRLIAGSLRTEPGMFVFADVPGNATNTRWAHSWWEPTHGLDDRKVYMANYNNSLSLWPRAVTDLYANPGDLADGKGPYLPFGMGCPMSRR